MSSPAQKPEITYRDYVRPDARLIVELYRAAQLLRPVDDVERIHRMYGGSNLVLTAWHNETLVGVLRGWHDGAYDGYVCDLAVLPGYQNLGVGRELLQRAIDSDAGIQWVLRSSKIADRYCEHLGWQAVENGWCWSRRH